MGRHDRDGNAVTQREGRRRDEGARDREREMSVQETEREREMKKKRATKKRTGRGAKKERSHDSSADTKQTKDRK